MPYDSKTGIYTDGNVSGQNAIGKVTTDFTGSRNEWEDRVIGSLISRYKQGLGGAGGYGDGSIGQPAAEDMGTPRTPVSFQTVQYWENYVKKFGASDPEIQKQFGTPPSRSASFVDDPNSASSIYGTFKDKAAENALDRASRERISAADNAAQIGAANISAGASRYAADKQYDATKLQVDNNWKIATLDDATRRYVAEGDWGVQKWVTTANNEGSMARLQLELGQRDEELAQRAVEEKNRHGEAMTGLALEVAKYDSELAASPRNWLKYAAWLKSRDIIVSGLTLAMAAQEVPDNTISPQLVANTTGMNTAGIETAQEAQTAASGTPAPSAVQTQAAATATGGTGAPTTSPGASVPAAGQMTTGGGGMQLAQPAQETPAQMAQRLLGSFGQTSAETTPDALQATVNSLNTTGGRRSSFGGDGSAMVNSQGISIPEANGSQVDYRNFGRLLPTQQAMKAGAVESVRGASGVSDWIAEMEKSRPKGGNSGASTYSGGRTSEWG